MAKFEKLRSKTFHSASANNLNRCCSTHQFVLKAIWIEETIVNDTCQFGRRFFFHSLVFVPSDPAYKLNKKSNGFCHLIVIRILVTKSASCSSPQSQDCFFFSATFNIRHLLLKTSPLSFNLKRYSHLNANQFEIVRRPESFFRCFEDLYLWEGPSVRQAFPSPLVKVFLSTLSLSTLCIRSATLITPTSRIP